MERGRINHKGFLKEGVGFRSIRYFCHTFF